MADDLYARLGVGKTASEAELKSAYRKLAKQYHPDLHPNDAKADAMFKSVNAAYDLLSDKEKRAAYDRGELNADGQPQMRRGPEGSYRDYAQGPQGARYYRSSGFGGGNGGSENMEDLSDLFGSMFGRTGRGGFASPPDQDVRYALTIDFLEAARGASKRITLPGGRTLDVTIPEGIESGKQIRLKGQGNKAGGQAGDAYIEINVTPHLFYTRKGNDIYADLKIGFQESILAAKVKADTIHGPVDVTIPKGSGSDAVLRLKGKGIKGADHYARLQIMLPKPIDETLERAIREWAVTHPFNPREKEGT